MSTEYTGSLALHDMNGIMNIVRSFLLPSSIDDALITAGTAQPKPMMSGTMHWPESPSRDMPLSNSAAAYEK